MNEKDYFKKINELNKLFVSPSSDLKKRVLKSSKKPEVTRKPQILLSIAALFIFTLAITAIMNSNKTEDLTIVKYVTNQNYVAHFKLEDMNLDKAFFVELELPENIDIVSKNKSILKKKNFMFMWSVFSDTKTVSFPFKALEKGVFDLQIKILDQNMELIETKSITLEVQEG